jgi:hypothetical protein
MVVAAEKERERFRDALNARVQRDHPAHRGRPQWLRKKLSEHLKRSGKRGKAVSIQTCAYWLSGEKIAKHENATLLCEALGMTRGELFGQAEDPRLAAIVERWASLPENMKSGLFSMVIPVASAEVKEEAPALTRRAS